MGITAEEKKKTKEELINDYSQFEGIVFDRNNVTKKMNAFLEKVKDPSKEDIVKARNKFIAFEAVFSTRFPHNMSYGKRMNEEEFRELLTSDSITELKFFNTLSSDRLVSELNAYQLKSKTIDNYNSLKSLISDEYDLKVEKTEYTQSLYEFEHHGEPVIKGAFEAVTDGSLLPSEFSNPSEKTKGLLKEWQSQTDKIIIKNPPEKNLKDNLVKYAVMGELLTEENADKIINAKTSGSASTKAIFYSDLNNLGIFIFDNAMRVKPDARMNIHAFRKYMPEIRNEVNNKLSSDTIQPIKQNLRNSFNKILVDVSSASNINSGMWYAQAKMLKELTESTNGSDYDLNLSETEKQKCNICFKKLEFLEDYTKSKKEIIDVINNYIESEGTDPQLDPVENPQLFKKVIDFETKQLMLGNINTEMFNYSTSVLDYYPENIKSEKIINTDLLPTERALLNDYDKFENACNSIVLKSDKLSDLTKATTFSQRLSLLHPNTSGKPGIDVPAPPHSGSYIDVYEKEIAGLRLDEFRKSTQKFVNIVGNSDLSEDLKEQYVEKINGLMACLDETVEKRKDIIKDDNIDSIKNLVPVYKKYADVVENLSEFIRMNLRPEFIDYLTESQREITCSLGLEEAVEKTKQEYEHGLDFMDEKKEQINISKDIPTLTELNLPDYIKNLKSAAPELGKGDNNLIDNLETLKSNLTSLRQGEKDAINDSALFSNTADLFNLCKNKLNNVMESGSESAKFLTGSFMKAVNKEEHLFSKQASSDNKTVSEKIYETRKNESLDPAAQIKKFKKIKADLDKVSSRFGGNSEEFNKMYKAVNKLCSKKVSQEEHYRLVQELNDAAGNYIGKKSTVPHTDKGKKRLEFAKELQDLCRTELAVKSSDFEVITNKTNVAKLSQSEVIGIRKQNCLDKISHHINEDNMSPASYKFAEYIYLNKLDSICRKGENVQDKLSPDNINKVVKSLLPVTNEIMKKTSSKVILDSINSDNPEKHMQRIFDNIKPHKTVTVQNEVTKPTEIQPQLSI